MVQMYNMSKQFLREYREKDLLVPELDIQQDLDFGFHLGLNKPLQVKVLRDLRYVYKGQEVIVPEGFISDGTSYPFDLREAFEGQKIRAFLFHDWLCGGAKGYKSQKFTHGGFRKILQIDGNSFFDRSKMFIGVRAYNHRFFNWNNFKWD